MSRFIEVVRPDGTTVYVDKLAVIAIAVSDNELGQWNVHVHTDRTAFSQRYTTKEAALAGQTEIVSELEVPS